MYAAPKRGPSFIGTVIGDKYRLETPIGEGGMATVWLARHLTLDRPVAVKFIHVGGEAQQVTERFLREARVAAAVNHRNVVDIIDFGATDEGRPYMVMEYLEGQTLRERLDGGPTLSVADVIRLVARTLSGLAAVHEAGIVHRDVKPGNIFLVRDADGEYPKLLDFGVSRGIEGSAVESVLPSRENVITGTPQYMAPEQARGLRDIDHRSDIYAMGVVLYEVLTGRLPFDCDRVGDLIMMILTTEPVPLATLRPDLGDPVSRVVARAMARERDARYDDAREMRQALLDAAARTAIALTDGDRRIGGPIGDSIFPAAMPQDLMDAVGEAYEPGDSKVLPSSSVPPVDRRSDLPTLGAALPPPPPMPRPAPDTMELGLEDVEEEAGPPAPARWPWVLVALLVAGGATWVAAGMPGADQVGLASIETPVIEPMNESLAPPVAEPPVATYSEDMSPPAPEPPATITVSLEGVPEGATVTVDGQPSEGPIELPRGDTEHVLEVSAEGRRPWRATHRALSDGRYDVQLEPAQSGRELRRQRRLRQRRLRERRRQQASEMIFTDPGF